MKTTAIRQSARNEECDVRIPGVCTFDTCTTIWSHYRGHAGGKGFALKSIDEAGAYCCTSCDAVYDGQRSRPSGMTKEAVDLMWLQGHIRSLRKLKAKGLI
jgi:hypothetical protein